MQTVFQVAAMARYNIESTCPLMTSTPEQYSSKSACLPLGSRSKLFNLACIADGRGTGRIAEGSLLCNVPRIEIMPMSDTYQGIPQVVSVASTAVSPDFDMFDSDADLRRYENCKPVHEALTFYRDVLFPVYNQANKAAVRNQKYHRWITVLGVFCGTLAVLFAIGQLSRLISGSWMMWIELLAAVLALFAVVFGLIMAQKDQWLLQRYKAERCRLLKFSFLRDCLLWCAAGSDEESQKLFKSWQDHFLVHLAEIQKATASSLREWVKCEKVREMPQDIENCPRQSCMVTMDKIAPLVEYYQSRRLKVQTSFFEKRAKRNELIHVRTRNLPHLFFFGSVLAALAHFCIDILSKLLASGQGMHTASVVLIVLAASLPVLGAGVRTWKSSHQYARSACLYWAKHDALENLAVKLKQSADAKEILRSLWLCENFLEGEHREWLRLMLEAEWFA
jgi:hypothetical protein